VFERQLFVYFKFLVILFTLNSLSLSSILQVKVYVICFTSYLVRHCVIKLNLTRVPRVRVVESSNPKGRPNLTQRCKRFATASTSTQVAVLSWHYDAEMGTANSLHASA